MQDRTKGNSSAAMRCMEIRGGSRAVDEGFETPGLGGWLYSRPFEEVEQGGDLHYVSLCGFGVITRLVVADVSGHGAEAAGFSHALRELMRKNINTKSQTRLVGELNRQFGEKAGLLRFATAVVATYLATQQTLTVCNAGHPRPLWFQAETGQWRPLDTDLVRTGNLPLGLDDETPYGQFTVRLGRGDFVLVYTDALSEATDGSGRMLGEEGLLSLVRGLDANDPGRLAPALLEAVGQHRGGRPADDDVTLLCLRHDGRGPRRRSIGERLDVYAKVFGLKGY